MGNNSAWISIGITFGLLIVAVAGAVGIRAAFQTNKTTQTITNYEKSLASWKERATSAEADLKDKDLELVASKAARDALEQKYAVLESVVTGKHAIERVGERVEQHFDEMNGQLAVVVELLKKVDPKINEALRRPRGGGAARGAAAT